MYLKNEVDEKVVPEISSPLSVFSNTPVNIVAKRRIPAVYVFFMCSLWLKFHVIRVIGGKNISYITSVFSVPSVVKKKVLFFNRTIPIQNP